MWYIFGLADIVYDRMMREGVESGCIQKDGWDKVMRFCTKRTALGTEILIGILHIQTPDTLPFMAHTP